MNQIAPYPIWVGHGGEGHDFAHILDLGIEAVVELAGEEPCYPTRRDLIACHFPLIDGVGNRPELLALATRTVACLLSWRIPTLVCCGGGMSRAPAIIAAALSLVERQPIEHALKQVACHHHADISPGLWSELVALAPSLLENVPPRC